MPQNSKLDKIILDKIRDGSISVDAETGLIYGISLDLSGKKKPIGHCTKGEFLLTIVDGEHKRNAHISRIVWLSVHGPIPENKIISRVIGKSDNSITNLKLIDDEQHKNWSKDELKYLSANFDKPYSMLCDRLNRSYKGVYNKAKSLGLISHIQPIAWSDSDDHKLLELKSKGISVAEIANILGRTYVSIVNRTRIILSRRPKVSNKNFYRSLRDRIKCGVSIGFCCICDYNKHIELHHIDSNRKNNNILNICTLCPTHHTEADAGEISNEQLFSVWCDVSTTGLSIKRFNTVDRPNILTGCVSGYFNPLHSGHIDMISDAKSRCNNLIVIVNNDLQVKLKGSIPFMDQHERMQILRSLKNVDNVVLAIDNDRSVSATLKLIKPSLFFNGGDVVDNCREAEVCRDLNIKMIYNVGGNKTQSSSNLIATAAQNYDLGE